MYKTQMRLVCGFQPRILDLICGEIFINVQTNNNNFVKQKLHLLMQKFYVSLKHM